MKVLRIDAAGVLREVNVSGDFGSINFAQEIRTVTVPEVLSEEIELLSLPVPNSVIFQVSGVVQHQGIDFEIVTTGSSAKLVLLNDLAGGGISEISAGDKVSIVYSVNPIVPTVEFRKEIITLTPTDIVNQYIDLVDQAIDLSEKFICSGLLFTEGLHYSVESVSGITRIHFEGDLSLIGNSPLQSGDIIEVIYAVNV